MRKYSYFYEGIYEKKLGIMRRGVAQSQKQIKDCLEEKFLFNPIFLGRFLVQELERGCLMKK